MKEKKKEKKGRRKEKKRERKEFFGFVRVSKTQFYISLKFSKQNFVFMYFESYFRYLTSTTLKRGFQADILN